MRDGVCKTVTGRNDLYRVIENPPIRFLRSARHKLDPYSRNIIRMTEKGKSFRSIAEELDVSEIDVARRYAGAVETLRYLSGVRIARRVGA